MLVQVLTASRKTIREQLQGILVRKNHLQKEGRTVLSLRLSAWRISQHLYRQTFAQPNLLKGHSNFGANWEALLEMEILKAKKHWTVTAKKPQTFVCFMREKTSDSIDRLLAVSSPFSYFRRGFGLSHLRCWSLYVRLEIPPTRSSSKCVKREQ